MSLFALLSYAKQTILKYALCFSAVTIEFCKQRKSPRFLKKIDRSNQ